MARFRRWARLLSVPLTTLLVVGAVMALRGDASGPVVGTSVVGTAVDGNPPGKAQDYRASANTTTTVDTLHVYLDASNTANVVGLGLYASTDATHAGRLLARCGIYSVPPNVEGWRSCAMTSTVSVTSGTRYWLAVFQPTGTTGTIAYRDTTSATGGQTFGSLSTTLSSLAQADPWKNNENWGAQMASVYADLAGNPTPTPSATPTATPTVTPSPTPTPTPTTTPTPGACATATPNVPDGPDPSGGCFPGPSNTGVPDGTVLTDYTGPCTITAANTVIDSKTVNCYLEIHAPGVVIRNSLINGHVWVDDPNQGGSFTITDSTVDAGPVDATHNDGNKAIGKSHFTAIRVETVRGVSGIFCEYDCHVQDSWVHGQATDAGGHAHESGIRMGSGSATAGQSLTHSTVICDAPNVPPDAGCSADVTGYGDFATIQNNLVDRNLLEATTGGACAYGGSTTGKPFPNGTNNVWRDNIFQHRNAFQNSGHCGFWFAIIDLQAGQRGNTWTNNRWDTGELMPSDG
jgi:hypothetical protein